MSPIQRAAQPSSHIQEVQVSASRSQHVLFPWEHASQRNREKNRTWRLRGFSTHKIDLITPRGISNSRVNAIQPRKLDFGTQRDGYNSILRFPPHGRDIADGSAHRLPANPFRIGIRREMDSFDDTIGFQQLKSVSYAHDSAVVTCFEENAAIDRQRTDQACDDCVFTELVKFHG